MGAIRVIRYLRRLLDVDSSGIGVGKSLQVRAGVGAEPPFVHEYVVGAGVTDHGALTGLADDDHPQYTTTAEAQVLVDTHANDTADAHDASAISVIPFGSIAATDVQDALEEIVAEAAGGVTDHGALTGLADDDHPQYHNDTRGDARYWQLSTDLATQTELDAHVNDAIDAHDASSISIVDAGSDFTATDVEGALDELQADHEADVTALSDHIADALAAHAASAVSASSATLSGTAIDVQGVLEELDNLLDDHSSRHENGGADEMSVTGLSGELADAQPITVRKNTGADAGTRSRLNLIEGSNVTLTVADDAGSDEVDITIAASGGSGEAIEKAIVQVGHGLAVGNVVRLSGTSYIKAQANTESNAEVVGIVSSVAGPDDFTIKVSGRTTGLSGLTAGAVYYLDDDTAGLLTATEPADTGDISKPLLIADTTTSGWIFNMRGFLVSSGGAGSGGVGDKLALYVFAR